MQKYQWYKRLLGSHHTTGTAKGIDLCIPFSHPVSVLKHELQLSFCSPNFILITNFTAKIKLVSFPDKW
jgi:hypothetical protein